LSQVGERIFRKNLARISQEKLPDVTLREHLTAPEVTHPFRLSFPYPTEEEVEMEWFNSAPLAHIKELYAIAMRIKADMMIKGQDHSQTLMPQAVIASVVKECGNIKKFSQPSSPRTV